jgi:anthraniloyl-CoA monooxygenase
VSRATRSRAAFSPKHHHVALHRTGAGQQGAHERSLVKITILGGGPAGLYCGLLLKKADPTHEISVIERNPPDATYGWGVVFSDRTLASFREADYKTYAAITDHFVLWDAIDVRYHGEVLRCGGHVFAGIPRKLLLQILQRRCIELGVALRFHTEVSDLAQLDGCDLLIAADGVNSLARKTYAQVFGPSVALGRAKYIWLGTDKVLDAFTFIFRTNEHGLFQVHAYPFSGSASTFIVECDEATWQRAGLDRADEAQSIAYCEALFAADLGGHVLLSNNSKWVEFATVKNRAWHHGNVVLLGDAAHTAHFSIGSGTKLAMEDAIALANAVEQHRDVAAALAAYEEERRPVVEAFQEAARASQTYFEEVGRSTHLAPAQFAFHLLTRSGRISYDDLRLRDERFVTRVDRWFAASASARPTPQGAAEATPAVVVPSPVFAPLHLRGVSLPNRVALAPLLPSAADGMPDPCHLVPLQRAALAGAGLVSAGPVAVAPEGRVTPGDLGMYHAAHAEAWVRIVATLHDQSPALVAITLGHAGRRGATRPRAEGLDRPLGAGGWPLLAASPLPYTPRSQVPRAMDRADIDAVREAFVRAARLAATAGFDVLQLDCGHGYLLASFLSPLSNVRTDAYGGSLENRMRYPLEVCAAVRAVWPAERPLVVALNAADGPADGFTVADAVIVAQALKAHGCDLIDILAGWTTPDAAPAYGRGYLTALSDRVRNEARVPTLVGGYLTSTGEVNTILAAGRADLCRLDPPELRALEASDEGAASDARGADAHAGPERAAKPGRRSGPAVETRDGGRPQVAPTGPAGRQVRRRGLGIRRTLNGPGV